MRFSFTAFGLHNPYIIAPLPDHGVYPLSRQLEDGLDLDYTSLLLGNNYIIDRSALEFVRARQKSFLGPMAATLARLESEGFLTVIDYGDIVQKNMPKLIAKTETLVDDPEVWLPELREQWNVLCNDFKDFHIKYGSRRNLLLNTAHFGVVNLIIKGGGLLTEQNVDKLTALFTTPRRHFRGAELDQLREIIKPLVAQVLINELVRRTTSVPFLDWDDAKVFYDKLYLTRWDDSDQEAKIQKQAHILFNFIVPELRPKNIDAVIRFIREDQAVKSLREILWSAVCEDTGVSHEWFTEYVNRAVQKDLTVKRVLKRFRWIGAVAKLLLPGGSLFQDVAALLWRKQSVASLNAGEATSTAGTIPSRMKCYAHDLVRYIKED